MTLPIRSATLRVANLEGEAMMTFRHGDDLYPYCEECQKSAFTEAGILGCTEGDDADVVDYSERFEDDPDIASAEKCPGFEPRQEKGQMGLYSEGVDDAGEKDDAVDLYGMMEGGNVDKIKDKRERDAAIVRILQGWKGGVMAIHASNSDSIDTIYEAFIDWKQNVL